MRVHQGMAAAFRAVGLRQLRRAAECNRAADVALSYARMARRDGRPGEVERQLGEAARWRWAAWMAACDAHVVARATDWASGAVAADAAMRRAESQPVRVGGGL